MIGPIVIDARKLTAEEFANLKDLADQLKVPVEIVGEDEMLRRPPKPDLVKTVEAIMGLIQGDAPDFDVEAEMKRIEDSLKMPGPPDEPKHGSAFGPPSHRRFPIPRRK